MAPKRKKTRPKDEKRAVATELERREQEAKIEEIAKSLDGINPQDVRDVVHPFETAGLCGDKPLSVMQKSITFCINYFGGAASDIEILGFLRRYWTEIIPSDLQKGVPDKRILHINLALQKERRSLFVKSPEDPEKWILNHANAPIEQNRRISDQVPFQERMLAILRAHEDGMTVEELADACEEITGVEGIFQHLPLRERVRTCLTLKKHVKHAEFDPETNKWFAVAIDNQKKFNIDDFLPDPLKGMHIKDMSINDLWNALKEKQIY